MTVVKVTYQRIKVGFDGDKPNLYRCSLCSAVVAARAPHVKWHETLLHVPNA